MITIICMTALILIGMALLIYILPLIINNGDAKFEKYTDLISFSLAIIAGLISFYLQLKYLN